MSAQERPRPAFLRACDRCRSKKIKCNDQQPCEPCTKAGAECAFGSRGGQTAGESSSNTESYNARKRKNPVSGGGPALDRRRSGTSTSARQASVASPETTRGFKLDLASSAHYFHSHDGLLRLIGPTSGVALLDAARLVSESVKKTQPALARPGEQQWTLMNQLLGSEGQNDGPSDQPMSPETLNEEYFPGRETTRKPTARLNLLSEVTAVVPLDLLAALVNIFFEIIHSSWPILHPSQFLEDLNQWSCPSASLLLISMCMLASRHSSDIRVYAEAGDRATAGAHLQPLFDRISRQEQSNPLYEIMAYFFLAQYSCTDNIPQPAASTYFGIAFAKTVDSGLHRTVPASVNMTSIEREMRKRTGWAVFCWDKCIAALFGRNPFIRLFQISIDLPEPFEDCEPNTLLKPLLLDKFYIDIYRTFISISSVLDFALNSLSPHARFPNAPFLDKIAEKWNLESYEEGLQMVEEALEQWRESLPPAFARRDLKGRSESPLHSVASEQIFGTEMLILMLVHGRRLFLATVNGPRVSSTETSEQSIERGQRLRRPLMQVAKDTVQSCIQLGMTSKLETTDILFAYRVLVAGRLLLSCSFCAKADGDRQDAADARKAVQAALMLLDRLAEIQPISLGAAETLEETCRIYNMNFDRSQRARAGGARADRLWYRPLNGSTRQKTQPPPPTANPISFAPPAHIPTYEQPQYQSSGPSGLMQQPFPLQNDFSNNMPSAIAPNMLQQPDTVSTMAGGGGTEVQDWLNVLPDNLDLGWLLPAGLGDLNADEESTDIFGNVQM